MRKKSRHSDPFLGLKSHSMQQQGLELMRLSLANIELVKKIIQFSTVFSTIFYGFGRSQNSKQPFYGSSKLLNRFQIVGGYQNFRHSHDKTAPKSFFYTDKIEFSAQYARAYLSTNRPNLDVVIPIKPCRNLAVVIPIKPLGNLAVNLM